MCFNLITWHVLEHFISVRKYMEIRSSVCEPNLKNWHNSSVESGIQTDGSSCGVFVAMVSKFDGLIVHFQYWSVATYNG